jgi:serine/threonine protein kinase
LTASHEFGTDAAESPLAADTVLQNRYRIVRQLGRGGMGAVYEAEDQRLGISVALKETLSSEASMRKQFEHEARLLASMQHSALPRVSDHFVEGNRAFLVMQFIGGVDLARIIAQQPGPLPREQVIAWADQLLDALIYLHSRDRQVIHRDIKPHNLKLTATGQIALLDFGLARTQSAQGSDVSITSSKAFFGYTRHYAPIEQIQDQRTDPRTDIYALGATLYHLLTGIKPPDAMVRATALANSEPDPLRPANKVHEAVGPEIAAILNNAMAQKAEHRYASANEFREAFRRMGRAQQTEVNSGDLVAVSIAADRVRKDQVQSNRADYPGSSAGQPGWGGGDGTVIKIAMVESARRFGPGSMTVVFVVLLTLGVAALYGSQRWLPGTLSEAPLSKPASTVFQHQPPAVATRSERPRSPEGLSVIAPKTKNTNIVVTTERPDENKPVVTEAKSIPVPGPAGGYNTARLSGKGKARRRIGVPSIRFPNPEFRNNTAEPSPESRMRTYTSSNGRPQPFTTSRTYSAGGEAQGSRLDSRTRKSNASSTPRFFRAPDGTQIVKFSGGLTRVVRPGERTARAEASYR